MFDSISPSSLSSWSAKERCCLPPPSGLSHPRGDSSIALTLLFAEITPPPLSSLEGNLQKNQKLRRWLSLKRSNAKEKTKTLKFPLQRSFLKFLPSRLLSPLLMALQRPQRLPSQQKKAEKWTMQKTTLFDNTWNTNSSVKRHSEGVWQWLISIFFIGWKGEVWGVQGAISPGGSFSHFLLGLNDELALSKGWRGWIKSV